MLIFLAFQAWVKKNGIKDLILVFFLPFPIGVFIGATASAMYSVRKPK